LFQNIALPSARTPSAMKIGSRSTGRYGHGAASTFVRMFQRTPHAQRAVAFRARPAVAA
jgi:hypothetical protein